MAATVNLSELTDILECAICLDSVQNPKTLFCNHSYCKRCLDSLLKFEQFGAATIQCPKQCPKVTRIRKDQTTNDLGIEYMLKHIVDMVNAKEIDGKNDKGKFKCDSQECTLTVCWYCTGCDSLICATCALKHDKCQLVIPISPIDKEKKLTVQCKAHTSEANFICCFNEFVCIYCLNRTRHKGHDYDTVDSQVKTLKDMLLKEIREMDSFIKSMDEKLQETKASFSNSKHELEQLLKWKKSKCLSDYIDHLNKEEERILKEFDAVTTTHMETFFADFIDPTYSYKEYLTNENFKIILQKGKILDSVKGLQKHKEKIKGIKEMNISISDHLYDSDHPLGDLKIRFGTWACNDKTDISFKCESIMDKSIEIEERLLYMEKLRQETIYGMDYIENSILKGRNKELNMLLQKRPDIFVLKSKMSPFYNQPIHMAAKYNNVHFLNTLLQHNSEMITFKNAFGSNPIHAAASFASSYQSLSWLTQKFPKMLETYNDDGNTALHVAACSNVLKSVQLLVDKGANIWAENKNGNTPLDLATMYNCADVKKFLQEEMDRQRIEHHDAWY